MLLGTLVRRPRPHAVGHRHARAVHAAVGGPARLVHDAGHLGADLRLRVQHGGGRLVHRGVELRVELVDVRRPLLRRGNFVVSHLLVAALHLG